MPIDRRRFLGGGAAAAVTIHAAAAGPASDKPKPVYAMGSRRELFVDDFLVERTSGELFYQLHHPIAREQVIRHAEPWEGVGSAYHTVFQDGDTYRMYYRGHNFKVVKGPNLPKTNQEVACYAESRDGIHWVKPELGLFDHQGNKKTNIVWRGNGCHNFSPFVDHRPGCPDNARLKALGGLRREGGLYLFQSPDGVRWSLARNKPVITNGYFDSQNIAFWDPTIRKYRAYWRFFTPAETRAIRTAVSDDLLTWSDERDLTYVDSPEQHMYTNNIIPYFRAPHILLGFPMRYTERGWNPSMRALPDLENRRKRIAAHPRYGQALTETQIMSSRDGTRFALWNDAFLPPGIQRPDSWYYAHNSVAWNIVTTKSSLPGAPDELSFYAGGGQWHGPGSTLTRHTLRQDGFVSVRSPSRGGELITRPITFQGRRLTANFATSAAGTMKVELQSATGEPIPGFSLSDADETFGNELDRTVSWGGSTDVGRLANRAIRIRVTLRDADLYAIKFS